MIKAYKLADGSLSTDCKVGDKFEVVVDDDAFFKLGEVIGLVNDDGSSRAKFKGKDVLPWCLFWHEVKPLKPRTMTIAEIHKEFNIRVKL